LKLGSWDYNFLIPKWNVYHQLVCSEIIFCVDFLMVSIWLAVIGEGLKKSSILKFVKILTNVSLKVLKEQPIKTLLKFNNSRD
jgi:hypothetical protein